MMVCAAEGKLACFNVLMEFNSNLELTDSAGRNALHFACRAGNVEVAREIMSIEETDIDCQTLGGMTPLMYAVESGKIMMVVECLNHTCSPFAVNALGERAEDLAKKYENSSDVNNVHNLVHQAIAQWKD